jgi:hypothetical protein
MNALGSGASAGSSLFAIVQAGANAPQEVPTGTSLLATSSDWVAFTESTNNNDSSNRTGTNLTIDAGSNRSGSNLMIDAGSNRSGTNLMIDLNWFAANEEPKRIRSNFYNKERWYVRQIDTLKQQLDEARQQKATTVCEALLTEFSGVSKTAALRSALEV